MTTQTPSINNCLDAIVLTKQVIAILVTKLVDMATTSYSKNYFISFQMWFHVSLTP